MNKLIQQYISNGWCIIPIPYECKVPAKGFSWMKYQTKHPTEDELRAWFGWVIFRDRGLTLKIRHPISGDHIRSRGREQGRKIQNRLKGLSLPYNRIDSIIVTREKFVMLTFRRRIATTISVAAEGFRVLQLLLFWRDLLGGECP